jgi:mannosyltransferase OCH1-like enzyme
MTIPKIVHQIWLGGTIPDNFKELSRSFPRIMPDWEHRIWDDERGLDLVSNRFPELSGIFSSLESPVAKCDLLRYMILFEQGGMYADMDCECKRNLDFIADDDELVVCKEVDTRSVRVMNMYPTDISPVYCQWTFLARPHHPALKAVLEHIRRSVGITHSDHLILDFVKRTGPHAFTAGLTEYVEQGGALRVIPASYFGCFETKNTFRFMTSAMFPELFRTIYVRHHFAGSWLDDKVKKKMMLRNLLLMPEPITKATSKKSG